MEWRLWPHCLEGCAVYRNGEGFVGASSVEDQELSFGNIRFEALKNTPIFAEIEDKIIPFARDKRHKTPMNQFHYERKKTSEFY